MSPVRAIFRRTLRSARSRYSDAFAFAAYLAGSAALFAFNLASAEGSRSSLAAIWAVSAAPVLPLVSAFAGAGFWAEAKRSGEDEMLLTTPLRERECVAGVFAGVWAATMAAPLVFLGSSLGFLALFAPKFAAGATFAGFVPAVLALFMQGAVWSAVAVAAGACAPGAAAAVALALAATSAIPRATWFALAEWAPEGRPAFGEMPLDAHVFDFASGVVSTGVVAMYVAAAFFALFLAGRRIALARLAGRRKGGARFAAHLSVVLAAVFAALATALAWRLDATLDLPAGRDGETRFSPRTRSILSEARGSATIVVFVSRKDPRFREAMHFARSLERESREVAGIRLRSRCVDPVLDLGEARRLAAAGVAPGSVAFERDGRIADSLALDAAFGERACASVIERIALPFRRRCIYWTTGHGETSFDDYGPGGMSDIARDLALDGYSCRKIDLASADRIEDDCALVIAAGPKTGFSAAEADRLKGYLEGRGNKNEGGRLLALYGAGDTDAPGPLLAQWGIKAAGRGGSRDGAAEIPATGFNAMHPATRPLAGEQVIFERPVSFAPSQAADGDGGGADRRRFTNLLSEDGACYAAAAERGAAGVDLAIRPTRIIAIGDAGFVANAQLRSRANANRDFFLNAVKYLAGRDAMTDSGTEADRLVTGMDRPARARFALWSAVAFPGAAYLLSLLTISARRRRK